MDLPHLLAAMTLLLSLLGGVQGTWRFDRMTTVLKAGTSDLTSMFASFSKHHAVSVVACRPRSGKRKVVVEKKNHAAAKRWWWRNLADELTPEQEQHSLTAFARTQDTRRRAGRDGVRGHDVCSGTPRPTAADPVPRRGDGGAHRGPADSDRLARQPLLRPTGAGRDGQADYSFDRSVDPGANRRGRRNHWNREFRYLASDLDLPASLEEANLRTTTSLEEHYDIPVGYSVHEMGPQISTATVTLGAVAVEAHIALDRGMWGSDR